MLKKKIAAVLLCLLLFGGCSEKRPLTYLQAPETEHAEVIVYGKSGSGRYDLTAYRFGSGRNVLLLTFAMHGWEDGFPQDGQALVLLGNQVISYLDKQTDLVERGEWSVYVIPCVNPDGLYLGSTCNGAGRCTLYSAFDKGIDINRSFPYAFSPCYDDRNYNGGSPLACDEASALADFVEAVQGAGKNICVDTHGWYAQVLTTDSNSTVYSAFLKAFAHSEGGSLAHGNGYFSAWCGYELGFDACLLELPPEINNLQDYEASGASAAYLSALEDLLIASGH